MSLSVAEAAAFLRIHPDTLQRRAAAGIIPGAKIGRRWVFIEADLVPYMRRNDLALLELRRRIRAESAKPGTGAIYMLDESADDSPVKIGFSSDDGLRSRIRHLQVGSSRRLRLLACYRATVHLEKLAHDLLAPEHLRGEWFARGPLVRAMLSCQALAIEYPLMAAGERRWNTS